MPRDRDGQQNQDEFSLDAILAEFGSGQRQEEPPAAPFDASEEEAAAPAGPEAQEDELGEKDWFPTPPPRREEPRPETPAAQEKGRVTAFPGAGPRIQREEAPPPLPPEPEPEEPQEDNVLEFPAPEPENRVVAGIDHLRRKADQFAEHMYEGEEDSESAKEARRVERLIPGVDEEEVSPAPVRERKPRKKRPPAPDIPPAELSKRYSRGLKGARLRSVLAFLLLLCLAVVTGADRIPGLPGELMGIMGDPGMRCYLLAGLQALMILVTGDIFLEGLIRPFQGRMGMELLICLANLFTLADALTLPSLAGEAPGREPFCLPAALGLLLVLWGRIQERRGLRLCCRTAAAASEPYLVTRDEGKWNNRDTYTKWSGPLNGFGSQVQGENGAERIYRVAAPILLLAAVVFSLLSSVGRRRPEDLLWSLSATFTAAGSLSATLCFGLPWRRISARLSKSGAALAGWQGVTNTTGSCNLLLTDIDLFPVGSVSLNGVKIFGDFPIEKVVAVTATVIRDSGCALDKVFHDLLRSQGAVYRRGEKLTAFEGGGLSEIIRGEQVLIGSASFMVLMDVALPPGLKVKNAVFCAIDGELAGIFALNYHLPGSVAPAIDSLIQNRITPVLATRDFNLIPSMLRQRFKLPAERLEFPPVNRRRELSDPEQEHSETLAAILCREGLGPYAEAVVGGRRLRSAVRLSAALSCLGSMVGILLAFYLTCVGAYDSLTPLNLAVFLLAWMLPTPFIAGWVDRY